MVFRKVERMSHSNLLGTGSGPGAVGAGAGEVSSPKSAIVILLFKLLLDCGRCWK